MMSSFIPDLIRFRDKTSTGDSVDEDAKGHLRGGADVGGGNVGGVGVGGKVQSRPTLSNAFTCSREYNRN